MALVVRTRVLREPLGLKFNAEELKKDELHIHFAAKADGDEVIGTLMLVKDSSTQLRMRQVAVLNEFQGQGVGRTLVEACEAYARKEKFKIISLHARIEAVNFYADLGYEIVGAEFIEVGIVHRTMRKVFG